VTRDAPLVDGHFHIWDANVPISPDAFYKPKGEATVEQALATLDAHGVVMGVAVAASLHGTYAEYLREALHRHKRLRATAIVDSAISTRQLRRMRDAGFVGIRFVWGHLGEVPDLRSSEYRALLRRVADLDWHVHFHEREDRIEPMIRAIEDNGVRKIVLDHIGRIENPAGIHGDAFGSVLAAIDRGHTWIKLSGGFRFPEPRLAAELAAELVRATGGDRLVWGSDWPFAAMEDKVTYADTIRTLEEWVPDPAIRRKIGGENALRLFFS